MMINLSNHPSSKWSEAQIRRAAEYGEIIDIAFPEVDPHGDSNYIDRLVQEYFEKVMAYGNPVVMLQGEFVFSYRLINRLKSEGIQTLASTSERKTSEYVDEHGNTMKRSEFQFVNFREY